MITVSLSTLAVGVVTAAVVYLKRRRPIDNYDIETFLKSYGSPGPKRYSYAELKKITNSFSNKLGEGSYGTVYRGKLHDGNLVAVKLLKNSKGNVEEFINEVATIGRTNHINIITLLGCCFEAQKRALVYDYMPNGSLEKLIYKRSSHQSLGWETVFQIAVGIARGLEYLHQGCNTRILHFDIKPHNILLDEDFCPKISDFGLAKSCQHKDSIIPMSIARGTVGYIAPEVFLRSFGGVSYKSDVYSYGMLVLEIVGCRRNADIKDEHSDEECFPNWIYKQLEKGKEIGPQLILNDIEREIQRKMIMVSLWCIQTNPFNRPNISRVVEMLEGKLESLSCPPIQLLQYPGRSQPDSSTVGTTSISQVPSCNVCTEHKVSRISSV